MIDPCDDSCDNLKFLFQVKKYNADPVAFVEEILGVDFNPYYKKHKEMLYEIHREKYTNLMPYNKIIMALGQRSGKSAIGTYESIYGLFEGLTVRDRHAKWGVRDDQLITIAIASNSMTQLEDGIYYDTTNMLEKNDWFNSWFDLKFRATDISSKECNTKIRPLAASSYTAAGRSVLRAIIDEIDLFDSTVGRKSAMELVNVLSNGASTFGDDGKVFCLSSPKLENGTILSLYNNGIEKDMYGNFIEPKTFACKYPTWEINTSPALTREMLIAKYKFDMDTFYRDFACDPRSAGGLVFPTGINMFRGTNILDDVTSAYQSVPHVLAIDPAATSDKFGLAVGYHDHTQNKIIVDGVGSMSKKEGAEYLSPVDVKNHINDIIDHCNVTTLIYDTYMYMEILEFCEKIKGVTIEKHIVDKPDYDRIKELQSYGSLDVIFNEYVQHEFKNLITKQLATKIRVDHSPTSSKDIADCVANVTWYLNLEQDNNFKPRLKGIYTF